MPSRKNNGFSLLELMITVSLGLVMCGVTFIYLTPSMNSSHVNSAYETTLMALRNTRNLAITQSHQYQVNFNPAGLSCRHHSGRVSAADCASGRGRASD